MNYRKLDPEQALEKLQAAGWYIKQFNATGVVAASPVYPDFNLGISGQWVEIGTRLLKSGHFLWAYPCDELEEVLADMEKGSDAK